MDSGDHIAVNIQTKQPFQQMEEQNTIRMTPNPMPVTLTLSNSKSNMLISNTIRSSNSILAMQCYTGAVIVDVKCFSACIKPGQWPAPGSHIPHCNWYVHSAPARATKGPSIHNTAKFYLHKTYGPH